MAFPSSIDSFTNPSGGDLVATVDHAAQHTNINTAINSIESVIGTNSGTAILKNFTAGIFAARQNSETMGSLTVNSGTINTSLVTGGTFTGTVTTSNFISGTLTNPVMTGGTATSSVFITPVIQTWDGWQQDSDTWTYVSASVFKIIGKDVTARFPVGTKIKVTDAAATKYFYVIATSFASDTSITVSAGSSYTLSGGALTNTYYSYTENPQGFPGFFNWTPTFTGFSADPSGGIYRFYVINKNCLVTVRMPNNGTSNTTAFTLTAPIQALTLTNMFWIGYGSGTDNTSTFMPNCQATITSGNSTISLATGGGATGWTASGGKKEDFTLIYSIA
jgi:hypothetical protein